MSVRKAGPGLWRIRWRVGGKLGQQRKELFRGTHEEARKREAVLRGEAAKQARPRSGERVTLRRLWERYEAVKLPPRPDPNDPGRALTEAERKARVSPSWAMFARRMFEAHFLPRWGVRRVDELRAADLVRFRNEREGKVSGTTINRETAALMVVLNFGEAEEWIERNPVPSRRLRPYREQRRTRIFTAEEFKSLLRAFDDPAAWKSYRAGVRHFGPLVVNPERGTARRHGGGRLPGSPAETEYRDRLRRSVDVFAALLLTASRRGEILGLRWQDVDFRRGVVRIALPKTARRGLASKTLPLVAGIKEIIERQGRGVGDAPVFQKPSGGAWDPHKLSAAFTLAVKLAGLEEDRKAIPAHDRLTVHSTRHTAETWLARSDFAEAKRSAYLGHAGDSMADHYTHVEPADLIPLAALLSERIGICGKADLVRPQVRPHESRDVAELS